ncbi:sporulation protein [Variovorax sp. KK3]|uniref:sporulation protein n=1 Tax=Variovorax sp. KK3 TaxID=1855728 RepID=UPI00097CBE3B|nr:sporulation protein [Variovorax sp. KK3]
MPLRVLVVLLLVANLLYFTWSRGGLAMFGMVPASLAQGEPERLTQQIRPQMLKILKDESAPRP